MGCVLNASLLARYIVGKCYADGQPVSNLQLQKILYFLQVVYCQSIKGEALLFSDEFEAWPYGPVLPSVYEEFSAYGGRSIEKSFQHELGCDSATQDFIDAGIEALREKSPWDLVRISHADGSPWQKVFRDGKGYKDRISNELIVEVARQAA